jgi:DNA (cytosine-5)-methyltransferase 1
VTFLSLFAGIGGIDLGLERAGMRCIGQVEIDPYCRAVLAKHWPDVPRFDDVRTFNAGMLSEQPGLICGGFPCQDVSFASPTGTGLDGERSGLWREFHRLLREIRPLFAVVENVAALTQRGLGRVLGDLADIGFDAEWSLLSACSMGAPHVRQRLFIVAYPNCVNGRPRLRHSKACAIETLQTFDGFAGARADWKARLANSSALYGGADGVPAGLDRNRGVGNSVAPAAAEWIGRRLMELPHPTPTKARTA